MTTQTTSLGPNSSVIAYSANATLSEIVTAIDVEIRNGHGWTQVSTTGSSFTYTAPNKDGSTTKRVELDYTNTTLFLDIQTSDGTKKVSTILADNYTRYATFNRAIKGQFFIFANPQWLMLTSKMYGMSTVGNDNYSYNLISGCIEIARDNPLDTVAAGLTPYCWFGTQQSVRDNVITGGGDIAIPKTLSGNPGGGYISTILGCTSSRTYGKLDSFFYLYQQPYSQTPYLNSFNSKNMALTMYAIGPAYEVKGRMFGIKLFTKPTSVFLDKHTVPVDINGFFDVAGTQTDHYVLPGDAAGRFLIPA